jgi:hypothetical protein
MALAADGHSGNASHTRLVHLMTENDVATTMAEDPRLHSRPRCSPPNLPFGGRGFLSNS